LLYYGAEVNAVGGPFLNTPLHLAALNADHEGIALLSTDPWSANKTLKNKKGETPEDIVVQFGQDFSRAFLGRGISLNDDRRDFSESDHISSSSTHPSRSPRRKSLLPDDRSDDWDNDQDDHYNEQSSQDTSLSIDGSHNYSTSPKSTEPHKRRQSHSDPISKKHPHPDSAKSPSRSPKKSPIRSFVEIPKKGPPQNFRSSAIVDDYPAVDVEYIQEHIQHVTYARIYPNKEFQLSTSVTEPVLVAHGPANSNEEHKTPPQDGSFGDPTSEEVEPGSKNSEEELRIIDTDYEFNT